MKQVILAVVLLLGSTGLVSAAANDLEIHDQQGVRYISGGMTKDELDEFIQTYQHKKFIPATFRQGEVVVAKTRARLFSSIPPAGLGKARIL